MSNSRTLNLNVRDESDVHGFTREHPITNSNPRSIIEVEGSYGTYGAIRQGALGVAKHSTLKDAFPKTSNIFDYGDEIDSSIQILYPNLVNTNQPESYNPDFDTTVDFRRYNHIPDENQMDERNLIDKPGNKYPNVMYASVENAINANASPDHVQKIQQNENDNYGNDVPPEEIPVNLSTSVQETIGRYLSNG